MAREGHSRGIWITPEAMAAGEEIQRTYPRESESKIFQALMFAGIKSPNRVADIEEFMNNQIDDRRLNSAKAKLKQLSPGELQRLLEELRGDEK